MVPNHQPAHDILCLKNPQWHTTIPYQTLWHHEHPQWIWNGNSKKGCDKIWYNYKTYKQNVSKKNHLHPFMIHVSSNCSYIPSQMFPPQKNKNVPSRRRPRDAARLSVKATLKARELLIPGKIHQGQGGGRKVGKILALSRNQIRKLTENHWWSPTTIGIFTGIHQ